MSKWTTYRYNDGYLKVQMSYRPIRVNYARPKWEDSVGDVYGYFRYNNSRHYFADSEPYCRTILDEVFKNTGLTFTGLYNYTPSSGIFFRYDDTDEVYVCPFYFSSIGDTEDEK